MVFIKIWRQYSFWQPQNIFLKSYIYCSFSNLGNKIKRGAPMGHRRPPFSRFNSLVKRSLITAEACLQASDYRLSTIYPTTSVA